MKTNCPHCGKELTNYWKGDSKSKILIVADAQTKHSTFDRNGYIILLSELDRLDFDINRVMTTSFYLHSNFKDNEVWDQCLNYMKEVFLKKITKYDIQHCMLMGAETVKMLTDVSIMKSYGLAVQSDYFGFPVYIAPKPNQVIATTLGEFRVAVSKFVRSIENATNK